MKKIKIAFLILAIFICTACGRKVAITGDDFYSKTKEDYTVSDISEYYDFAESAYELEGKNKLDIKFIETDKIITVQSLYVDEVQNAYKDAADDAYANKIEEEKTTNKVSSNSSTSSDDELEVPDTVVKSKKFSTYEVSTNDTYYRIVWVDKTLMIGKINVKKKTTLLNLMKELGY